MIRMAVVGAGQWGPNLLRNLHDRQVSEVRWVIDLDEVRLGMVRARFPEVQTGRDAAVALADPAVDAVVIATPTSTQLTRGGIKARTPAIAGLTWGTGAASRGKRRIRSHDDAALGKDLEGTTATTTGTTFTATAAHAAIAAAAATTTAAVGKDVVVAAATAAAATTTASAATTAAAAGRATAAARDRQPTGRIHTGRTWVTGVTATPDDARITTRAIALVAGAALATPATSPTGTTIAASAASKRANPVVDTGKA